MPSTELVPISEAARALGVGYFRIYRKWQAGEIPSRRSGSYVMVKLADVRAALAMKRA